MFLVGKCLFGGFLRHGNHRSDGKKVASVEAVEVVVEPNHHKSSATSSTPTLSYFVDLGPIAHVEAEPFVVLRGSVRQNVIPSFASTRCCVDGGHRSTTSTLGCSTNTILHTSGSLPPLTSIAANLYSNLLVHHTEESNSRTRNAATVGER